MRNCHIFNGGPSTDVFWRAVLTGWALDGWTVPFILFECFNVASLIYLFIYLFIMSFFFYRMESGNSDTLSYSRGSTPLKWASAHCGVTVWGQDPKKQPVFIPNCGYSIVCWLRMLQRPSTPAEGLGGSEDSNSINRNFNIYSLGGFPLLIYDDQRDVKGAHLVPLWMGPRGTKTFTCFPSQLGMYPKLWQNRVKLGVG